jgi:hypothetical protein
MDVPPHLGTANQGESPYQTTDRPWVRLAAGGFVMSDSSWYSLFFLYENVNERLRAFRVKPRVTVIEYLSDQMLMNT